MTDGLPTPQLWYHPYQSGVEYSVKNRADEAVRIEHHELPIDVLASVTLARLNNEVRV